MSYPSIDKLQQALAKKVFHYAKDSKKAAGRALGTLVELITFYLFKDWGMESGMRIEKGLGEYGNSLVSHNVEYTLHPEIKRVQVKLVRELPITSTKILTAISKQGLLDLRNYVAVSSVLLSSANVVKNSCVIARGKNATLVAVVLGRNDDIVEVGIVEQYEKPFAMVECKRVGVEEGNKKGPQTIEKAKQGAYVARAVSSLQKVRNYDGTLFGILSIGPKNFRFENYEKLLSEVIATDDRVLYRDFILTIGVVSNHGNWFTADNPNKELLVLRDAYDWLLFLTDNGIATFIDELLLNPKLEYAVVKKAFISSYTSRGASKLLKKNGKNQFTKAQINEEADLALQKYFKVNRNKIEKWMNVITPPGVGVAGLKNQLDRLSKKKWIQ